MIAKTMHALLKRELTIAWRGGGTSGLAIGFFIIVGALFPFAVGPDPLLLQRIASGIIWVAVLLAALLSAERIFAEDFDDGSLEQLALSPLPLEGVVFVKGLSHWLTTAVPLLITTPILAVLLQLPRPGFGDILIAMAIGTPGLSFVGMIGAALTVAMKRGGLLTTILVLPLYLPTLIFGVIAAGSAETGLAAASLYLLAALSLGAMALAPFAAAAALKLAME